MQIIKADKQHVDGIAKVCTAGYWATYGDTYPEAYISRVIEEFYNADRIRQEVETSSRQWGGYFVAVEDEQVMGAGGGGMTGDNTGEIFVLYIDLERRNEGIGTKILNAITAQQREFGAREQWVSVLAGNQKGIPFYEAKGFVFQYEQPSYGNEAEERFVSLRYCRDI